MNAWPAVKRGAGTQPAQTEGALMSPPAVHVLNRFCTEQAYVSRSRMGFVQLIWPRRQCAATNPGSRGWEEKVGWMMVDRGRRNGPACLRMFTLALTWEVNIPFGSRKPSIWPVRLVLPRTRITSCLPSGRQQKTQVGVYSVIQTKIGAAAWRNWQSGFIFPNVFCLVTDRKFRTNTFVELRSFFFFFFLRQWVRCRWDVLLQ